MLNFTPKTMRDHAQRISILQLSELLKFLRGPPGLVNGNSEQCLKSPGSPPGAFICQDHILHVNISVVYNQYKHCYHGVVMHCWTYKRGS